MGCIFGIIFCAKCNGFVQGFGGLNSCFLLKIVSSLFYCIVFCYVLLCSCYSVDVVEVAPPGAAEDHRSCSDMRTKDHPFCCTCVCLCRVPNSCETFFFYGDLALNALPVHLLRQVYFLMFLCVFSASVFVRGCVRWTRSLLSFQ